MVAPPLNTQVEEVHRTKAILRLVALADRCSEPVKELCVSNKKVFESEESIRYLILLFGSEEAVTQHLQLVLGSEILLSLNLTTRLSNTIKRAGEIRTIREGTLEAEPTSNLVGAAKRQSSARDVELQQLSEQRLPHKRPFLPLVRSEGSQDPSRLIDMAGKVVEAIGLADAMEDLGYSCTHNEKSFEDIVNQFAPPDETVVAHVLAMMAGSQNSLDDAYGTQAALANVLSGQQATEPHSQSSWNVGVVIKVLKSRLPSLQPEAVFQALDNENFNVPDAKSFLLLTNAWKQLSPDPFPLQTVIGSLWRNSAGQLSFLRHATAAPPDLFTFEHALQKMAPLEGLRGGKSPLGMPNQAWLCLDLYRVLSQIAAAGHQAAVRKILEHPAKHCPEVLFVGMAAVGTEWGLLQQEVCEGLAPSFVEGHNPNSSLVLPLVWPHKREVILRAMLQLHRQDPATLPRLLDVCLELKALPVVLDATPFDFAVDLAALAACHRHLDIETWLQDRANYHRLPFLKAVIYFVAQKVEGQHIANGHGEQAKLWLEVLAVCLRVLQANALGGPAEVAAEVAQVKHQALKLHPELQALIVEAAAASSMPTPAASFPPDIEEEANAYFQKLYASEETVEALIARLKSMRASSQPREQEVFRCMIQSLFDEYRFFHKYPEKELQITAALFGGLITSSLLADQSLGDALRLVLDALRNPAGHKMCTFGLKILTAIADRLSLWPQYCKNLLQASLKEKDGELGELAGRVVSEFSESRGVPPGFEQPLASEAAAQELPSAATGVLLAEQALAEPSGPPSLAAVASGANPQLQTSPQQPSPRMTAPGGQEVRLLPMAQEGRVDEPGEGSSATDSSPFGAAAVQGGSPQPDGGLQRPAGSATQTAMDHKRAFQAVNAETLELASQNVDYLLPPHKVQDRIGFLINNLSSSNLEQKAKELQELLTDDFWPWFCNYMVVKRAAQEQNFHGLYGSLLNALQNKELWRLLVATTYKYIKILLASERIKTQSSERTLLKNLGSWLGRVTIAQGQPVKHKDLDVKGIIVDAYEQGKMIAVLPFVNKVLEPCKDSKVFRPPNPWISGILSLMAEIYGTEKLKLNLTFEIEMLFRNFNLQISDTRLSKELANRKRDMTSGTDFTLDKAAPEVAASPARGHGYEAAAKASSGFHLSATSPARLSADGEAAAGRAPPQLQPGLGQDQGLIGNYHNHVHINPSLQPVAERLGLKRMVPVAVDRAVADIITPVVERSVTIACMTTQELVLKDFASEPEESRMRKAAHLMVSSLAGSLALVTCREPLRSSLAAQLRHLLANTMDARELEHTVQLITSDNFELGCTIIEKSATDKAIRDINDRLAPAFQARQKAAAAGQPFFDAALLHARFPQSLPEALRPKPSHLRPHQQQRVYEDFARIPRAGPQAVAPGSPHTTIASEKGSLASGDRSSYDEATLAHAQLAEAAGRWLRRLDHLAVKSATGPSLAEGGDLEALVAEVLDLAPEAAEEQNGLLARHIFLHMFEVAGNSVHSTACAAALGLLRGRLPSRFPSELTVMWAGLPEERKWRKDVAEALLRARLLNAGELDAHVAKALQLNRSSAQPVEFAVHLVRQSIGPEPLTAAGDLFATLDVLQKLVVPQVPGNMASTLQQLIDQARRPHLAPLQKGLDTSDPPEVRLQVSQLLDEWVQQSDEFPKDSSHDAFVSRLQQLGFLKGDEMTDQLLRIMTNLAVTHSLAQDNGAHRPAQLSYLALDAYAKLIVLLVHMHSGGAPLLERATSAAVACLLRDAELRGADFNGRPYYRILLGFIQELAPTEPGQAGLPLLCTIATALLAAQPLQAPGFAFPWLELVSHRNFMPRLVGEQAGWPSFQKLLIALLRFVEPYLRNAELTDSVRLLYKGTLRLLLVLLHDFPEFLCEYHFEICNVVPPSCIQMRNLILSAFPRNMRLPDPFTPNLKVDLLPEIGNPPRFRPPPEHLLPAPLRAEVESYLSQPLGFVSSLQAHLMLPTQDVALSGTRYNVSLLNAVVFYVGIQTLGSHPVQSGSSPNMCSPGMDLFQQMASELDTEGRYLFLNALANQLRYPNNHTHYFSCVLLYLFSEAQQEIIQEQITRVLLERLIVNRPHPWGLLITFIELIKNPRYNFWNYNFTRCAGEIERLFESVARSCMGAKAEEEAQVAS